MNNSKPRLLTNFYIRNKFQQKVKFTPNRAQVHYLQNRTGRDYVLKARQLGFTTLEQLRKLERALLEPNIAVATIAHQKDKTEDIFKIAKFAWDNLSDNFRSVYGAKYDNVKELDFSAIGSRYFVDLNTRSKTVNDLHVSELAFIKDLDDVIASSLGSVTPGGSITFETTANGLNQAYELWQDTVEGKNEFKAHFYNWTWDDGYFARPPESNQWKEDFKELAKKHHLIADIQSRFQITDAQFYWYYLQARTYKNLVKQEYPTTPEEAFLSASMAVFDLYMVSQLREGNLQRMYKGFRIYHERIKGHKYIVGIDTAEGTGNDHTSIEVWDVTDPNKKIEVASYLDDKVRPDQAAKLAAKIGVMYNKAFIIPEKNSSGLTTTLKLQEMDYENLFKTTVIDKATDTKRDEFGWRTTSANRDVLIDDFIELFEDGSLEINSWYLIMQMKTFVRKENGRREHDKGYHDDSIFGSGLAMQGMKYTQDVEVEIQNASVFGM